jgi:hypothetical protein
MSNKTTIQSHNTRLQNLIDTANSLPDAGSGGGAVETCTVTIEFLDNLQAINTYDLGFTVYENDKIVTKTVHEATTQIDSTNNKALFDLENVVCGSAIVIYGDPSSDIFWSAYESDYSNIEMMVVGGYGLTFSAPSIDGEHFTLTLWRI